MDKEISVTGKKKDTKGAGPERPCAGRKSKVGSVLRQVVEATSSVYGDEFFHALVRTLALATGMGTVFVGEALAGPPERVRTLAVWSGDGFAEGFEYDLKGSPCEQVLDRGICCYPSNVAKLFPEDALLTDARAESYVGVRLTDSSGALLGVLAAVDTGPLAADCDYCSLLPVFAARVAIEFERMKAEAGLKRSEEHLREAQRIARMGSWEWDIPTGSIYWSDEIFNLFGIPKGPAVTYDIFLSIVHPEDRGMVTRAIEDALANRRPYDIEHRIVRPDGAVRIMHERARVCFGGGGKPLKMAGTVQDVTEKRRTDEELLRARKLESIGELAGGIAHDFNNLLLGIMGGASLARKMVDADDRVYRLLGDIGEAAARARDLTKRLLTFSTGGLPVREAADVAGLMKDSASVTLKETGTVCEFSLEKGLWSADVDEGQLSQVFSNVFLNASQAMEGSGTIAVTAQNVNVTPSSGLPLEEGRYIRVSVKDAGHGIPRENISRVFDPFFTTRDRASGLGLAVTYSVVRKHGGHITVESENGNGAAFHIYLPAAKEARAQASTDEVVMGAGRVLVMDDEELIRDVTAGMLDFLGYASAFACDGAEAVELYAQAMASGEPFDAMILDLIVKGGMGGKEAVRKILDMDPAARVIVSSGYSGDEVLSEHRKYGFVGVVVKPYRVAEFSIVVRGVIEGRSA